MSVSVCLCLYVCVRVSPCISVYVCLCLYVSTSICLSVSMCLCSRVCVRVSPCIFVCLCPYVSTSVCLFVYPCLAVCVHVSVCVPVSMCLCVSSVLTERCHCHADREIALEMLSQEEVGSFVVRDSTTHPGCYALSVKVPKFDNPAGISHYLITRTAHGGVKLKVS